MRNTVVRMGRRVFIKLESRSASLGYLLTEISPSSLPMLRKLDVRWYSRYSQSSDTYYVQASSGKGPGKTIHLHRILKGLPKNNWTEFVVNHKDGNGLNNKLSNLEVVSKQLNHILGTPKKRIRSYWDPRRNLWRAQLNGTSKVIFLGYFESQDLADKITMIARKLLISKARKEKILYTKEFMKWIREESNKRVNMEKKVRMFV